MSGYSDDILIVGGGLAGLFCALQLAPRPVTVLAAAPIGEGASSAWAQGGIAAAISEGDTVDSHLADTIAAGAGIVDAAVARAMVAEGPARVDDLLRYGVPFDRDLEGRLMLSREAAHSQRRVVRVSGDMAGRAIMEALVAAVRKASSITVLEGFGAERLIVEDGRAVGLIARSGTDRLRFKASHIVLCTGGIGHLYEVTTNPLEARGDGLGMAARAGAVVADAEFVQFHPTAIAIGRDPAPLATEALRGEGAILVNGAGHRFMRERHADGELAPRDIVARGIFAEVAAGRGAFLDARDAVGTRFAERFPTVYRTCMDAGIDPAVQPIPVATAAHYHMGGIATDGLGRTSIDGLHAAGEVASTGVHGANRLASNSLLEAVVFAGRIADTLKDSAAPRRSSIDVDPCSAGSDDTNGVMKRMRALMSRHVGVIRDAGGLESACEDLESMHEAAFSEPMRNRLAAAMLVAHAALAREESRGGHSRSDYPEPDQALASRSFMTFADGTGRPVSVCAPDATDGKPNT